MLNRVSAFYAVDTATPEQIEDYRQARLNALIEANRDVLDRDPSGEPVRKRELIASNPDPISLANASQAGFQVVGREQETSLGLSLVTLSIPRRMNIRQALRTLHQVAPAMQVDYNHIYEPSGGALLPFAGTVLASSPRFGPGTRIAMIDGGVAAHPSLAHASIVQQGFAGEAQPTGHGTAVGSLLVGEQGPFRGAARGAQLFVGDVYGGNPAAGSVSSIIRAINWAASKRPAVINISLVGPNNIAFARTIAAVQAQGIQVVAAVGNDGPAAPKQYPASFPGVVAVTGVDARGKALPEAGRAGHLDFAAPGADMIAAFPGTGYTIVRGTSFAAPLAAARLALTGSYQNLVREARPGKGQVGRGIVCWQCRVDPAVVRRK
jgi:subtilisin family serine protease